MSLTEKPQAENADYLLDPRNTGLIVKAGSARDSKSNFYGTFIKLLS